MSYLEQILGGAQQRGGLTDDEFNTIFQQFIPQQQGQTNLGMGQQPVQRAQMIKQTQVPMSYGTGVNTARLGDTSDGTKPLSDLYNNVRGRYDASNKYNTDMFSTQTGMLAEQDRGMFDNEEEKEGLLNSFKSFFA